MKVLVTGHRGYVGAVVVPVLLEAGFDVSGYDLDYYGHCTYSHGGPYRAVPTIQKDIRDAVPADFEGFEAVVHLAELPDAPGRLPQGIVEEVNHRACVRVALAARQAGVSRLLVASSCAVYGKSGDERLDETGPLNPQSEYAIAKVLAEHDVAALATTDFSPTFLRLASACGLSPRLRFDIFFNRLVASAVTEGRIPLPPGEDSWRPLVHLQDVARAMVSMLRESRTTLHNQVFNVGATSNNYRLGDLAQIVADVVTGSEIVYEDAAFYPTGESCRLSFEKLSRVLPSAVPQWTPRLCAEQLQDAFRASMLTTEEFERTRYDRAAELIALVAERTLDLDLRRTNGLLSGGVLPGSEGLRVIQ